VLFRSRRETVTIIFNIIVRKGTDDILIDHIAEIIRKQLRKGFYGQIEFRTGFAEGERGPRFQGAFDGLSIGVTAERDFCDE
jgi:hypothetical protein